MTANNERELGKFPRNNLENHWLYINHITAIVFSHIYKLVLVQVTRVLRAQSALKRIQQKYTHSLLLK